MNPGPSSGVVLLVEDDSTADRLESVLRQAVPDTAVTRARCQDEFVAALGAGADFVVFDGRTSDCRDLLPVHLARQQDPSIRMALLPDPAAPGRDEAGLLALGVRPLSSEDLGTLALAVTAALQDRAAPQDRDRAALYEQLVTSVTRLSLAGDLPNVMATVRSAARRLTGADGATFVLRDHDICYYADEDAIGPLWKGSRFPIEECVSGWAMLNRQPAVIGDIYQDPRVPVEAYEPTFVRSLVMVPIRAIDPIGAIGTYWARERQSTPDDVRILQALADTTAVAIENVRIQQDLERRVRQRTEELEAFTYAVSHDLRAPIRHISGYATMLREQQPAGEESTASTLDRLVRSVDGMRDMVNSLLEMSRATSREPVRCRVDLAAMAREIAEDCRAEAQHAVDFVAPAEAWADADPILVRNLLQNLIGNAWKFTGQADRPRVEFGVQPSAAGTPVYFVADNGAGFNPAHADRLFGVFQRLHSQDAFPGTGVGLASARRIVQRHGGGIEAVGAPGQGATFSFTLEPALQVAAS